MKKIIILFGVFFWGIVPIFAEELTEHSESAVLMELSTGKVLYEKDSSKELAPASMTKIMSMILIMDAIKDGKIDWEDDVLISENASNMGGSQVYLNTYEKYKIKDLFKSIAIASANDAVVAMSEKVAGSEEKFVELMNNKCALIGCKNTSFTNPHGLDQDKHYSSAKDMAIMASYLIKNYPEVLDYTSIYEDYLDRPDGSKTWLVNTNKLVRFYENVDGLKTGYTEKAGYCLTATSMRNSMRLITVVMGVDNQENRTFDTVKLFNYGFNNYRLDTIYKKDKKVGNIRVSNGKKEIVNVVLMEDASNLRDINEKEKKYSLNVKVNNLKAPLKKGNKYGYAEIIDNEGNIIKKVDITVDSDVKVANLWDYYTRNMYTLLGGKKILKSLN